MSDDRTEFCPICGKRCVYSTHRCDPKTLARIDNAHRQSDEESTHPRGHILAERLKDGFAMMDMER